MPPKKERATQQQEDKNAARSASLAKQASFSVDGLPPALFQSSFASLVSLCFAIISVPRPCQLLRQLNVEPLSTTLQKVLSTTTSLSPSVCFTVALLLHHVVRLLSPLIIWGHPAAPTPLEDLRLALSHPLVFLEDHVPGSGGRIAWTEVCKWLIDLAATLLAYTLIGPGIPSSDPGSLPQITQAAPQNPQQLRRIQECMQEAAQIIYLVYAFSCVEYALNRSMNTITMVIMLLKFMAGPAVERNVLWPILAAHRGSFAFCMWYLGQYISQALAPILYLAMTRAWFGRPDLLSLLLAMTGGIIAILKHRSKLIIALEMSDLFVTLGLAVGGATVLASYVNYNQKRPSRAR